jgi:hypothetical protein
MARRILIAVSMLFVTDARSSSGKATSARLKRREPINRFKPIKVDP